MSFLQNLTNFLNNLRNIFGSTGDSAILTNEIKQHQY